MSQDLLKIAYDLGAQAALADLEKLAVFKVPLKEMLSTKFGPEALGSKVQGIIRGHLAETLNKMPRSRRMDLIPPPEHPLYGWARDSKALSGDLSNLSLYTNLRNKKNISLSDLAGTSPKDNTLLLDFIRDPNAAREARLALYGSPQTRNYLLG